MTWVRYAGRTKARGKTWHIFTIVRVVIFIFKGLNGWRRLLLSFPYAPSKQSFRWQKLFARGRGSSFYIKRLYYQFRLIARKIHLFAVFPLVQGHSLPFGDEKSFGIGWSAKGLSSYSAHAKIGSIFRPLLFAMTRLNRGLARLAMSSLKTIVLFKTSKGN